MPNLRKFWHAATAGTFLFRGAPSPANKRLLKLHGSLGWYAIEEGAGAPGSPEHERFDVPYLHFRLPNAWLRDAAASADVDDVVSGRLWAAVAGLDGVTSKAGAVWIRPQMVFARQIKTRPDLVSVQLLAAFAHATDRAATLVTLGYSWSDPHVNDLVLSAVAKGACLVDIGRKPGSESLVRRWRSRFPTTYESQGQRMYSFGGGARHVLANHRVELPSGEVWDVDLMAVIARQALPSDASIGAQRADPWHGRQ